MRTIFPVLVLLIALAACNKITQRFYTKPVDCYDPAFYAMLPQYADSELAYVIIRTFVKDSSFTQMLAEDTFEVNHAGNGDSYHQIVDQKELLPDHDYELIVPSVGDTFRLSRMTLPARTETANCSDDGTHIRCDLTNCLNVLQVHDLLLTKNGHLDTPVQTEGFAPGSIKYLVFKR